MSAVPSTSATLAIDETVAQLRGSGIDVVSMASGEIRLPVLPRLGEVLREAAERNEYGPVVGIESYRRSAAGYWRRRGVPAGAERIIVGPGSKALLCAALIAVGGDVVVPRPSWVSYAAQAGLAGLGVVEVDTLPGQGGVPDPDGVEAAVLTARRHGRDIRTVIVTLPDNPTGTIAGVDVVRRLADVARRHDLVILSDEIYYDLAFDVQDIRGVSPVHFAPERTIVTTGLTKNLAVGGWRTGIALLPDRDGIQASVRAVASHIWSSAPLPIQHVAAYALDEPGEVTDWVSSAVGLHRSVARAAGSILTRNGLDLPDPRATCYLYPDFSAHREALAAGHGVQTSDDLAAVLLRRFGIAGLAGSAFGQESHRLVVRLSTSQSYGDTADAQWRSLESTDPTTLPWVNRTLARLDEAVGALVEA